MKKYINKILPGMLILFLLLFLALGYFISLGKELAERHQPFEYPESFDFQNGSFTSFITYSQNKLRAARLDSPSEAVIKNASPFILEPGPECARQENGKYPNGIVLSHGLLASPYSMYPIGEYFQSRCFYVLGLLLPDHVTRPGDFIDIHWEDWAQVQSFATQALAQQVDNVLLAGHSAGGTLAAYEAAINPEVDGLILFAPAMEITSAAKYAKYIALLGNVYAKDFWYEIRPDDATYRYESITFSSARETYALIQATNEALAKSPLSIPVFAVLTEQDNTVNTDTTLEFMAQLNNPQSRTLLYSQHPLEEVEGIEVYISNAPEQGVLSLSHLGVMTPPSHPEYGVDGAYRSCGHYFSAPDDKLSLCQSGQRDFYGEVTAENLQQGLVERIAFNPFYDDMLKRIEDFMDVAF